MFDIVLTAIALVLVMEGMTPFVSPSFMRNLMIKMSKYSDNTLRIGGFILMVSGVILMYYVHSGMFD